MTKVKSLYIQWEELCYECRDPNTATSALQCPPRNSMPTLSRNLDISASVSEPATYNESILPPAFVQYRFGCAVQHEISKAHSLKKCILGTLAHPVIYLRLIPNSNCSGCINLYLAQVPGNLG